MQRSIIAALLLVAAGAQADNSFVAKTQVYTDSDQTTVVSPLVAISRDAWRGSTLSASWTADVITSASVDVVSNATHQIHEFRNEVSGSIKQALGDNTLTAGYIYSTEHDYTSNNVSFGIARDFAQRNTTLALGWSLSLDSVGRSGDRAFHRSLTVNDVEATWTQVLTKTTIAQLSYTFFYDNGYEASPYRFVRMLATDGSTELRIPEADPSKRYRNAIVAAVNQHLGQDTVLSGDYRIYFDSWGLVSHTAQIRYTVRFKDFTLRIRERFYYQSGASFYREHYQADAIPQFVTADRELSTLWSDLLGIKLSWNLPWWKQRLTAELKADGFYFGYENFAFLDHRIGANLEAGLSINY